MLGLDAFETISAVEGVRLTSEMKRDLRAFEDQRASASERARFIAGNPPPARPMLDAETERAARIFMKRLEGKYPTLEGLVFGSRARGTHGADSDADLAVILEGERGDRYAVAIDMAGIAVDVMMETGILVEALPLWESELQRPESFSNPALIETIRREGLRL